MATKKISELPLVNRVSGSQVAGGSVLPIVIGGGLQGTTNQISVEDFSIFVNAYNAHTGAAGNIFTGPQTINNNVIITGKLTVNELVATYETASIIYSEGGNIFGNELIDKQQFTGSSNFTGSVFINGQNYTTYSSSNSTVFTNFSSSNSNVFTNFSSSNSTYNTTFSSSNAAYVTALSSSNSSYNTTFSSSNSSYNTIFSSSNATYVTALSSSNSSYNTIFSSSNSTTITAFVAGTNSELARVYQSTASIQLQTASLLAFTASQDGRNFIISQYTSSTDAHIVGISAFTSSQLAVNLGNSIYTASVDSHIVGISTYTSSVRDTLARVYQTTESIQFQTASLLQFTASQDSRNFTLSQVTGSFRGEIGGLEAYSASLKAAAIVSSSTQVQNYDIFGLNSNLYTATGSLIGITNGLMAFTAALDNTYATDAQLYQLYQATASLQFQTASLLQFTASQDSRNFTLSQVTGSFRGEIGGLEAYTASLKNSTIVSSSTQIFTGYDNEIHVSQIDGNDTTGNGDLLTPVATITKALTLVTGQRRTVIIHPGSYTESPSITTQYTVLTTFEPLGGNTDIVGTVSTSVGCTLAGLAMDNLTITTGTGVGVPNIINCNISGTLTKSGNATFTDIHNCDIGTACNITGTGLVTINDGNPNFVTINNAGANVIIKGAMSCVSPSVTSGTLSITDSIVIAAVTNAVTSNASSVVTLANCQLLTSALNAVAPVSLSGFYSIFNCVFDKPNSTLVTLSGTGGSTNAIDYFQYINADKFITQGGTGYQFLKGDGSLDSIMPASLQQTTASLNLTTGSLIGITNGLMAFTAALDSTYATDAQLYQLYAETASIKAEIGGIEAYTASLKGAAIVSSSQQITNYYKFAETASANTFYGTQTIRGNAIINGGNSVRLYESTNTNYWDAYTYTDNTLRVNYNGAGGDEIILYNDGGINFSGALTASIYKVNNGGGIDFSATSNGSGTTTSELLNDYEEGTWTPVIGGTTSESGQSYSGQAGRYTKIGRQVTVTFRVVLSAKGTITGDAVIKGLPFTADGTGFSHGSGATYFEALSTSWNSIYFMVTGGETYASIDGTKVAGASAIRATGADISNLTQFNGSFTYFV
jgi:hypothetical protein